jgi:hypothetical protein
MPAGKGIGEMSMKVAEVGWTRSKERAHSRTSAANDLQSELTHATASSLTPQRAHSRHTVANGQRASHTAANDLKSELTHATSWRE